MKPTAYDIHDKVYVVLLPNSYEGTSKEIDPSKTYIFAGYVTGLRWDTEIDDWFYEVSLMVGSFWTWMEYIAKNQKDAEKCLASITQKRAC